MIGTLLGAVAAAGISSAAKHLSGAALLGVASFIEGQQELKQADVRMKRMDMLMNANPNDYIQMRVNAEELINHDFYEVVMNLAGMGFYDINIKEVFVKLKLFQKDQTGLVTAVSINGARSFDSLSAFPKDSHVIVEATVHKKDRKLYMAELSKIRQGAFKQQRPIRRCEYCGLTVSEGQKYCIGCGAPL